MSLGAAAPVSLVLGSGWAARKDINDKHHLLTVNAGAGATDFPEG